MQNTRGGDFVHVRLSDAGKQLVSQGPLTCVDGRVVVTIEKGNVAWSDRVMKAVDWELALKQIRTDEGAAIFELDEEAAPVPRATCHVPAVVCEVRSGGGDNFEIVTKRIVRISERPTPQRRIPRQRRVRPGAK
jgi:hypothetical protein